MKQRITIAEVIENEWFKKGYTPPKFEQANVSLDDVNSIFSESMVRLFVFAVILIKFCSSKLWILTLDLCSLWCTGFTKSCC